MKKSIDQFILSGEAVTVKISNKLPSCCFMKVENVREYMSKKAKVAVNFTGLDFYASIENVRPHEVIRYEFMLVKCEDLKGIMTEKGFREMECHVTQIWDEMRWYFKIGDKCKL